SDIDCRKPEFFVISAPQGGKEDEVINKLEKELPDREIGFLSIDKLYNINLESYNRKTDNLNLKFQSLLA
ncbi:MAG: hypothetical protein ACTSP3_03770, partial [Candidatus Heimdallarchaeaceae archaeon]